MFRFINSRRQPPKGYYLGALLFTIQGLDCIGALSFTKSIGRASFFDR